MKIRQNDFFQKDRANGPRRIAYGGSKTKGLRKIARPLDRKRPLHLVLKSSEAKGTYSLLTAKNRLFVEKTIRERAQQFGVTIQRFENVGNHLHAIVKFMHRESFQNFLRTITALIARFVTGARRGKPFGRKFWDELAFTRVITGFRDLRRVDQYLNKNAVERELGGEMREAIEVGEERLRELWKQARDHFDWVSLSS